MSACETTIALLVKFRFLLGLGRKWMNVLRKAKPGSERKRNIKKQHVEGMVPHAIELCHQSDSWKAPEN
jgi:hypothetical protein